MSTSLHLIDRIDLWADRCPDRSAHFSGGRGLTWRQLVDQSNALALWLDDTLSGQPGPIAVHGHKESEMIVAFLAAVKCGRPYVPMDAAIPEQRIAKIVAGAGAVMVLTPEKVRSVLAENISSDGRRPAQRVEGEDPFYILFTSGSTGEPKGVVITLKNLTSFVNWLLSEHSFAECAEVFLNQAPFSFDLSVMDLFGSLTTGGTLASVTKEELSNLKSLYAMLGTSGVTVWVSTPSFAQMCLIEKGFGAQMLPAMSRFLFCGETLAPETASQLLERFPAAEVWNTYGPTEATVATTSVRVDKALLERYSPLPVGYAMAGTRVLVAGESGQEVPEGERGEIVIVGPNVSPGYLNKPDITAKAFREWDGQRCYRTGDWGRVKAGLVFFEGRMDGQVKVNGYRIELGDLEANLRTLEEVADVVVLPIQKNGKIDGLASFVVLSGPKSGTDFEVTSRLKTQLGQRLPAYMIPRKFVYLDAFPMTTNGKADRRKLAELLG
ncbi:MAG: D-alanine--poly(phosphoribitol) ligase subunit DltA [Verrucomicrobiota bacterium]